MTVAICGATALLLAACSSSGSGSTKSTSASAGGTSTVAAPTGSPIKIGLICNCSGAASTGADPSVIYKAWGSAVNAAGGINGHPVQIIYKDDGADPAKSLAAVQSFISDDHVVTIVSQTNADVTWEKLATAAGIPVVGSNTATAPMYTDPNFYPEGQTEDSLFPGVVGAVKKANGTKLGLLYCAEAVECQEGIAPLKATAKAGGVDLVYSGSISATAPNYTAQCLAAKQAGVDTMFVGDVYQIISKVETNCSQQGYHPTYIVDGTQMFPALQKNTSMKAIFVVPNLPYTADSPAITEMNAALDKYAPGERSSAGYGEGPVESWISGKLFEAAAKAGGLGANGSEPTAAQVKAGLAALNKETLDDLAPPLTFPTGKAHPVDCWYYTLLENGKYTTPYGLEPTCTTSS